MKHFSFWQLSDPGPSLQPAAENRPSSSESRRNPTGPNLEERAEQYLKELNFEQAEKFFLSSGKVESVERVFSMYLENGMLQDMLRVMKEHESAISTHMHLQAADALVQQNMFRKAELQFLLGKAPEEAIQMYLDRKFFADARRIAAEHGGPADEKRVLHLWGAHLVAENGAASAIPLFEKIAGPEAAVELAVVHQEFSAAEKMSRERCPEKLESVLQHIKSRSTIEE